MRTSDPSTGRRGRLGRRRHCGSTGLWGTSGTPCHQWGPPCHRCTRGTLRTGPAAALGPRRSTSMESSRCQNFRHWNPTQLYCSAASRCAAVELPSRRCTVVPRSPRSRPKTGLPSCTCPPGTGRTARASWRRRNRRSACTVLRTSCARGRCCRPRCRRGSPSRPIPPRPARWHCSSHSGHWTTCRRGTTYTWSPPPPGNGPRGMPRRRRARSQSCRSST